MEIIYKIYSRSGRRCSVYFYNRVCVQLSIQSETSSFQFWLLPCYAILVLWEGKSHRVLLVIGLGPLFW